MTREEAEGQPPDQGRTAPRPAPTLRPSLEPDGRANLKPSTIWRFILGVMTLGLYELWWRRTIYSVDDRKVTISRGIFRSAKPKSRIEKVVGVKIHKSPIAGSSKVII